MNKVRTLAIALMALTLFACKKQEPKQTEDAVLSLRIDDAELRAIEGQINNGTTTTITENVVLTLDNGRKITLTPDEITKAKTQDGAKIEVGQVVNTVALSANAEVTDQTAIDQWQSKASVFSTKIPLSAPATQVTPTTATDGSTIYKVEFTPKPAFTRLEVFGKIEPKANNGKNAFESIEVKEVYINNYLPTRNATNRYFTGANATFDDFATTPALKGSMKDAISDSEKENFKNGSKAAAYQLFPKKTSENGGDYDHVVLKLSIKYSATAIAKGYPSTPQTRFVTITKFKKAQDNDLDSFAAGTIYKLDLKGLNDHFKTNEDGTPDPSNPDTTEPESKGKKELQLIVKPCTWTSQNILPEL